MVEINQGLFNEIGIDSRDRISKFKRINPEKSITNRIGKDTTFKEYLFKKYKRSNEESDKSFFKRILEDRDLACLIDLILKTKDKINEKIAKEIFKKEKYNEQNIYIILFEAYEDGDLLRKIYYSDYLNSHKHIILNSINSNLNVIWDNCNDEEIQLLLRNHPQIKQKNIINVWYALKTEDGIAFFIYAKAKSKKVLPSLQKKVNTFVNYSKPNIIYFKENGKKLLIYSKDLDRNIRYASAIVCEKDPNIKEFGLIYSLVEIPSENVDVDKFIRDLIANKIEEINLIGISFIPQEQKYDTSVLVLKNNSSMDEIFKDFKKIWGKSFLNSKKIDEVKILFLNTTIRLTFFRSQNKNYIKCDYSSRDPLIGDKFSRLIKTKYNLNLNKLTR